MSEETKSSTPSKKHKYFAYDQEGDWFTYFSNEKERDDFAEDLIRACLQDGWDESVESITTGTITATTKQTDVRHRKDQKFDTEGCDEEGVYWESEWDYMCNYELARLDT